jgi:predicted dehydrogenase
MTIDRRTFVESATVGLSTAATACARGPAPAALVPTPPSRPLDVVRVGFVGVGHQGASHVENFLRIEGVEIRAFCDINPAKAAAAQQLLTRAGKPEARLYTNGPRDFVRLCAEAELDLVFTATPWEWHAPVCVAAMEHGKHAATEVPMAPTLEELWQLVETAERTRRHCVMMENCCYDRAEMMILHMVRQGLFGELLHAECGYLHDLRELKLTDFYEGRWRIAHSIRRNGDLYPTHGLGPVAQWMDINRGNQFDYLVSVGTAARGLNEWAAAHIGPASVEARQRYALSDVVTTIIRTRREQTIVITHDTNLPRPYSRNILLQGTSGVVRKYPEAKIHIEGRSRAHAWEDLATYREQFEHPVWRTLEERSRGAGHGGMDYIEDYRLVQCLRAGTPTDMDVYDGAAWSAVSELSERAIAGRGRSMDFPDFTRGAWRTRPPLGIVTV